MGEAIQDVGKNNITTPTVAGSFPILKKKPKREQIRFVFLSSFFFFFFQETCPFRDSRCVDFPFLFINLFFFFLRFQEVLSQIFQQKKKEIQTKRKKRFFFSSILLSFLSLSIQEKWLKWMFQNSKEIVCSDF